MGKMKYAARCVGILGALLLACSASEAGASPFDAQSYYSCNAAHVANPEMAGWLREFYVEHAQPILGVEKRLANGVSWRLIVDGTTKLAMPRVTWMPDRQALSNANRLFEAVHGCAIETYFDAAKNFFESGKWALDNGGIPANLHRGRYFWQPLDLVKLTYATSRLASFFEVRVRNEEMRPTPVPFGAAMDLTKGQMLSIDGCDGHSLFNLGGLLSDCLDQEVFDRFDRLWRSRLDAAIESADRKGLPDCRVDAEDDGPKNRRMALYLTPKGLAVFKGNIWPSVIQQCMLVSNSPTNPIIIPYRELESFMNPGPWRDELLSLK